MHNLSREEILDLKIEEVEALTLKLRLKEGLPHLHGLNMYQWQHDFFYTWDKMMLLCAANQTGKGGLLTDVLPTPSGFKTLADINIGDSVFNHRGEETVVTGIPYEGVRPCYKITFDDGASVTTSQEHLWKCQTERNRFRPTYISNRPRSKSRGEKIPNPSYGKWEVLETQEIIKAGGYENGKTPRAGKKIAIPVCKPVQHNKKQLMVDPYTMGAMIGDGCLSEMSILSEDREIIERVAYGNIRSNKYYSTSVGKLKKHFLHYGLVGKSIDKFIPNSYLTASFDQRLELLRGLMDTDGSIYGKNTIEYCTISEKLKDNFIQLVNSLGGVVGRCKTKKSWYYNDAKERVYCNDAYSVIFKIAVNPFYIARKADKWRCEIRYKHQRLIEKIEYVGDMNTKCISVNGELYLTGREYIATHNSTIQIRKMIHLATCPALWPDLFPSKANDSNWRPVIWYLYPNQDTVIQEVDEKWEKEFLPRGEYKDHPNFGWKRIIRNKVLKGIRFNSGVTIYFKTYSQNVSDLQAGTVAAIGCDEELPEHIYPELNARLLSTDGFFSMAFTATLGQEFWRLAIQPNEGEEEKFPNAWKRQITTYDCLKYHDGSDGYLTRERIARMIESCSSPTEVQRRIFGKFIKDSGLKYFGFDRERNYVDYPHNNGVPFTGVPKGWRVYSGVDIGSGGEKNHPSAYSFLSVNDDCTKVRLFLGRRLDKIETTAGDTYRYYKETRGRLKCTMQSYDWGCKDFETITSRAGDHFEKANKAKEAGDEILNTCLKLGILKIYKCTEHEKVVHEFEGLSEGTSKTHAKDDFIDSVKYALASIPVDWQKIFEMVKEKGIVEDKIFRDITEIRQEKELRPNDYGKKDIEEEIFDCCEEEIADWNDLYGTS